jgi:hypothetical protein
MTQTRMANRTANGIAIVNKNILPEDCKRIRKKTYKYEGELNG